MLVVCWVLCLFFLGCVCVDGKLRAFGDASLLGFCTCNSETVAFLPSNNFVHQLQGCCIHMSILETHLLSRTEVRTSCSVLLKLRLFTFHCGRVSGFHVLTCRFIGFATSIPRPADLFPGIFHLAKLSGHQDFSQSTAHRFIFLARAPIRRQSLSSMSPSTALTIMSG